MDGAPASIVATLGMRGLCGFFLQRTHKDNKPAEISNYVNTTLDECRAIHDYIYETYLAIFLLLIMDQSIYVKLIKNLSN